MPHNYQTFGSTSTNGTNSSSYKNGTLRFLNESVTKSSDQAASRFMDIDKDNLTSEMILGGIALLLVLIIIFLLLCCVRYLYAKLPMVLKSLVMTVKAKLMWSSILRFMAQKYLD